MLTYVGSVTIPSYVESQDDCDDTDADGCVGAEDRCDPVDSACDGEVAEDDSIDAPLWYVDADGDGFGDPATALSVCTAPGSRIADNADCDDGSASANPTGTERCGGGDARTASPSAPAITPETTRVARPARTPPGREAGGESA